jgi:hypothetical protein
MRRRVLLVLAAVLPFAGAATLGLLAHDVGQWERTFTRDDLTFRQAPDRSGLFESDERISGGARLLLGIDDDLAFRRALELLWLSAIPTPTAQALGPRELRRAAELALAELARSDPDRRRRSQATNLLGVLSVAGGGEAPGQVTGDRLESAIVSFRTAVLLDDRNEPAKYNLELALLSQDPGSDESIPRSSGGEGALGRAGSGY